MVKLDNKKTAVEVETDTLSEGDDLKKFSKEVLNSLAKENIPPLPQNFESCFIKMLDEKSLEFKKMILEMLRYEQSYESNTRILMESDIKHVFATIKTMLQAVAAIYKNFSVLKSIITKELAELEVANNPLAVKNILIILNENVSTLDTLFEKHINILKDGYDNIIKKYKSLEAQAVYDQKYEVFNKKYFLECVQNELTASQKYGFLSSIVLVKISDKTLDLLQSAKDRDSIIKNSAKILMQTSRRSDIIAYYDQDIFAIIMKHTTLENAAKACERISNLFESTISFIDHTEVKIYTEISATSLDEEKPVEEIMNSLFHGLKECKNSEKSYFIIKPDANSKDDQKPQNSEQTSSKAEK